VVETVVGLVVGAVVGPVVKLVVGPVLGPVVGPVAGRPPVAAAVRIGTWTVSVLLPWVTRESMSRK
jgi:hypothetical protein